MLDSSPCRGLFSVESFSSTHLTSDAERESKALIELEIRVRRLVTSLIEKLEPPDRFLDNEGIVEQMVCEAEDLKSEIFGIEVDVRPGQPEHYLFVGKIAPSIDWKGLPE